MLIANPSGRDRSAPDLETIHEYSKHSHISQDSVSKMKKTCTLSVKYACSTCAIGTAHATFRSNNHACWAPEPPATGSSFKTLCIEVIALDVLLQTVYALLHDQRAYFSIPASFASQYLGWLNGYLKTHHVHGLNHLNLNRAKVVARQYHTSSSYLTSSSQLGYANAQDNCPPRTQVTDTEQALQLHVRSDTGHLCMDMHGSPPLRIPLSHYCGTRSDLLWRKKEQTHVQRKCRWNECPDCRSERAVDLKDEQGGLSQILSLDTAGPQEHKTFDLVKDIRLGRNYSVQFEMLKQSSGDDADFISIQQGDGSEAKRPEQKRNTHQQHDHSNGYSVRGGKRSIGSVDFQDNDYLNGSDKGGDDDKGLEASGQKRVKFVEKSRFACPFFKHDPDRYKVKRSCCGPGWTNVQRVKEHIFRSHPAPEYECPRCHKGFENGSTFDVHIREDLCEPRDRENLAGASQEAIKLLRSRSNKTKKPLTEEKKWCNMYKILFPNDVPVPSPYYDERVPESTNRFERSVIANFEVNVRKRLIEEPCLSNLVELTSPIVVERITQVALDALISSFSTSERTERLSNDARQARNGFSSDTNIQQPETQVQRSPGEIMQTTLPDGMANLETRQNAETGDISSNPQPGLTPYETWIDSGIGAFEQMQRYVPLWTTNDWTGSNNLEPVVLDSGDSTYGSVPSESLDRHSLDDLKYWTMEGPTTFFE